MKTNIKHCFAVLPMMLLSASLAIAQTPSQKQAISSRYNQSKLSTLKQEFESIQKSEKQAALEAAQRNNWDVVIKYEDGRYAELQKLTPDGKPIYYITYNVDAANSTRTNWLNSGGGLGLNLMGDNLTAHVWDGGLARSSHQEYDGPGGTNRFSIGDGSSTLNFHAAHVTGTIIASGVVANAKGMAPHANAIGYDWNSDITEATSAASGGMLISNHSYGYRGDQLPDWYFGAYIAESRDWDNLMYNSPYYLMVVAAGNDGNQNSYNGSPLGGNSSFDKLSGHSTAKNNMVVANAQDANIDSNGNLVSVSINSSSSEGPTDDYRIKPDITGNGTGVYSTYESSNTAYNSITGTSMASPNVAGSLLLLQEHYNNVNGSFARAATIKGLALHTADDAGLSGPDAVWGWGLLNAKVAAETITQNGNESKVEELTLSAGQTYQITVDSDGVNPLIASISWTDPAGTANTGTTNLSTPVLVNDLDIRVTKNSTTYFPYRLTGVNSNSKSDNSVDPYERVDVAGASGTYTITVTHKGSLSSGSQDYTLIVTGLTGAPVVCNATTPTGLSAGSLTATSASLSWNSVAGATYDVRYRQSGTSTWTTVSDVAGNTYGVTGLSASTSYEAQVRSKCPDASTSAYSSSVNFSTTAISYCSSNGNSVADEYISRVQLGGINNSSGAGSGGYSDFTSVSTGLTKGDAYTITVTPTWTGTVYSEGYSVWIDYNQDGDFTDAGEQVWTQSATQNTSVSGSFTVPTSATDGPTRMRVSMKYNGVPTSCESFNYGEVEDYTVDIGGATADTQAPSTPTSLTASNVTETTLTLNWNASTDNVGVTGYDVYQGSSLLGTVSGTTANVTGLTAGTTYTFNVLAKDAAGNESAAASTTVTTQSAGISCSSTVSAPYANGFESGFGGWTQASGDDFDWARRSGGTPSSNTGPSSAQEGSYYLYVESSSPNYSNKVSIIESPCFDLSTESSASFAFRYHMYGASGMGGLQLQASTDGTSWSTIWSKSGNQGNSWLSANVDLSAFAGGTVKLRYVGTTGTTWQGDMAIDNLSLSAGSTGGTTDVTLTIVLDNYPEETSWQIRDGGTVVASGGTYGSQPDGSTVTETITLSDGCYDFIISDAYGDGICCSYGNGSYSLTAGGTTLASGGAFGSSETTNFCVGSGTTSYAANFAGTSTSEGARPDGFSMHPNPVQDQLNLSTGKMGAVSYSIINASGKIWKTGELSSNQGKIGVSELKPGFYFIEVTDGENVVVKKFVKQ